MPESTFSFDQPVCLTPADARPHSLFGTWLVRLQRAVLADAIACYHGLASASRGRARRIEQKEATLWLTSDCTDDPFAFQVICEMLRVEPTAVRQAILSGQLRTIPDEAMGARRSPVNRGGIS